MTEKKKAVKAKKQNSNGDALEHLMSMLMDIQNRLDALESYSHEPLDFDDDIDAIDSRLSKVEGRMGL